MRISDRREYNRLKGESVAIVGKVENYNMYISMMAKHLSAKQCHLFSNSHIAAKFLKQTKCDFIILDETCFPLNVNNLVKTIRFSLKAPNLQTPIMILTERECIDKYHEISEKNYAQNFLLKPILLQDFHYGVSLCQQFNVNSAVLAPEKPKKWFG